MEFSPRNFAFENFCSWSEREKSFFFLFWSVHVYNNVNYPYFTNNISDIPFAPLGPLNAENITDSTVDLGWNPPACDGGSEITEFEIEYKIHRGQKWEKAGTVHGTTYKYQVKGLQESTEYSFRVTAHNEEGASKPLKSKTPIKTKAELGKRDIISGE